MLGILTKGAAAATVALALVASSANASHFCDDPPDLDVSGQVYVFVDCTAATGDCHGYLWSIWIYLESNGQPGAQRGGVGSPFGEPDICQNSANPDSWVME